MFKKNATSRVTRSSVREDLIVPKSDLCVSRKALLYSGAIIYNSLPNDIKVANNIMQFKTLAYKHYLEQYPNM